MGFGGGGGGWVGGFWGGGGGQQMGAIPLGEQSDRKFCLLLVGRGWGGMWVGGGGVVEEQAPTRNIANYRLGLLVQTVSQTPRPIWP